MKFLIQLLSFTVTYLLLTVPCAAQCPPGQPLPKLIGGQTDDTYITAFDFMEHASQQVGVVAGITKSTDIYTQAFEAEKISINQDQAVFIQLMKCLSTCSVPKEYLFQIVRIQSIKWGTGETNDRFVALTDKLELYEFSVSDYLTSSSNDIEQEVHTRIETDFDLDFHPNMMVTFTITEQGERKLAVAVVLSSLDRQKIVIAALCPESQRIIWTVTIKDEPLDDIVQGGFSLGAAFVKEFYARSIIEVSGTQEFFVPAHVYLQNSETQAFCFIYLNLPEGSNYFCYRSDRILSFNEGVICDHLAYDNEVLYCHYAHGNDRRSFLTIAKRLTGDAEIQFHRFNYQNAFDDMEGFSIFAGGMEKKDQYLYLSVATVDTVLMFKIQVEDEVGDLLFKIVVQTQSGATAWMFFGTNDAHQNLFTVKSFRNEDQPLLLLGLSVQSGLPGKNEDFSFGSYKHGAFTILNQDFLCFETDVENRDISALATKRDYPDPQEGYLYHEIRQKGIFQISLAYDEIQEEQMGFDPLIPLGYYEWQTPSWLTCNFDYFIDPVQTIVFSSIDGQESFDIQLGYFDEFDQNCDFSHGNWLMYEGVEIASNLPQNSNTAQYEYSVLFSPSDFGEEEKVNGKLFEFNLYTKFNYRYSINKLVRMAFSDDMICREEHPDHPDVYLFPIMARVAQEEAIYDPSAETFFQSIEIGPIWLVHEEYSFCGTATQIRIGGFTADPTTAFKNTVFSLMPDNQIEAQIELDYSQFLSLELDSASITLNIIQDFVSESSQQYSKEIIKVLNVYPAYDRYCLLEHILLEYPTNVDIFFFLYYNIIPQQIDQSYTLNAIIQYFDCEYCNANYPGSCDTCMSDDRVSKCQQNLQILYHYQEGNTQLSDSPFANFVKFDSSTRGQLIMSADQPTMGSDNFQLTLSIFVTPKYANTKLSQLNTQAAKLEIVFIEFSCTDEGELEPPSSSLFLKIIQTTQADPLYSGTEEITDYLWKRNAASSYCIDSDFTIELFQESSGDQDLIDAIELDIQITHGTDPSIKFLKWSFLFDQSTRELAAGKSFDVEIRITQRWNEVLEKATDPLYLRIEAIHITCDNPQEYLETFTDVGLAEIDLSHDHEWLQDFSISGTYDKQAIHMNSDYFAYCNEVRWSLKAANEDFLASDFSTYNSTHESYISWLDVRCAENFYNLVFYELQIEYVLLDQDIVRQEFEDFDIDMTVSLVQVFETDYGSFEEEVNFSFRIKITIPECKPTVSFSHTTMVQQYYEVQVPFQTSSYEEPIWLPGANREWDEEYQQLGCDQIVGEQFLEFNLIQAEIAMPETTVQIWQQNPEAVATVGLALLAIGRVSLTIDLGAVQQAILDGEQEKLYNGQRFLINLRSELQSKESPTVVFSNTVTVDVKVTPRCQVSSQSLTNSRTSLTTYSVGFRDYLETQLRDQIEIEYLLQDGLDVIQASNVVDYCSLIGLLCFIGDKEELSPYESVSDAMAFLQLSYEQLYATSLIKVAMEKSKYDSLVNFQQEYAKLSVLCLTGEQQDGSDLKFDWDYSYSTRCIVDTFHPKDSNIKITLEFPLTKLVTIPLPGFSTEVSTVSGDQDLSCQDNHVIDYSLLSDQSFVQFQPETLQFADLAVVESTGFDSITFTNPLQEPFSECSTDTCVEEFIAGFSFDGQRKTLTWEVKLHSKLLIPSSQGTLIPGQEYTEIVEILFDVTCQVSQISPLGLLTEPLYLDLNMRQFYAAPTTSIDIPGFSFSQDSDLHQSRIAVCDILIQLKAEIIEPVEYKKDWFSLVFPDSYEQYWLEFSPQGFWTDLLALEQNTPYASFEEELQNYFGCHTLMISALPYGSTPVEVTENTPLEMKYCIQPQFDIQAEEQQKEPFTLKATIERSTQKSGVINHTFSPLEIKIGQSLEFPEYNGLTTSIKNSYIGVNCASTFNEPVSEALLNQILSTSFDPPSILELQMQELYLEARDPREVLRCHQIVLLCDAVTKSAEQFDKHLLGDSVRIMEQPFQICFEYGQYACSPLSLHPPQTEDLVFEINLEQLDPVIVELAEFTVEYEQGAATCNDSLSYGYQILVDGLINPDYILDSVTRMILIKTEKLADSLTNDQVQICNTITIAATATTLEGFTAQSAEALEQVVCWRKKVILQKFQNAAPSFMTAIAIRRMQNYGEDFEDAFPQVLDPEGDSISLKCFKQGSDITNCASCPIRCERKGNQYVIKGNLPEPQVDIIESMNVAFTVELKDEPGAVNTYTFRILFVQRPPSDPLADTVPTLEPMVVDTEKIADQIEELETKYENLMTIVDFQPSWGKIKETERPKKRPRYPLPQIESISQHGLVTISVNPPIIAPSEEIVEGIMAAGSLQIQLVPGSDSMQTVMGEIEGKSMKEVYDFTWNITHFDQSTIKIQIDFKDPSMISSDSEQDQLRILFLNTKDYMVATDRSYRKLQREEQLLAVPNGYQIFKVLPPQENPRDVTFAQTLQGESVQSTVQLFGLANILLSQILQISLNSFWGSVNSIQIVAHLPLNNIILPASCYGLFADLISITSFDIFEPAEHFEFIDITETKPYNAKFEQLGYGSRNIIENMGSILILILIILAYAAIVLLVNSCGHRLPKCCKKINCSNVWGVKWFKSVLSTQACVNKVVRFILETFIELLICSFISMQFASQVKGEDRTGFDHASVLITYLCLALVISFPVFVLLLVMTTSADLTRQAKTRRNMRYKQIIEDVKTFVDESNSIKRNNSLRFLCQSSSSIVAEKQKSQTAQTNDQPTKSSNKTHLSRSHFDIKQQVKLKSVTRRVIRKEILDAENSKYGYFSVLYSDLKLHRGSARFYHFIFILRRFILIMLVLYGAGHSWIQVHFFILSCIFMLSFLMYVKPLNNSKAVTTEIINELFLTAISYHMVLLTGYVVKPNQKTAIGLILLHITWLKLFFNCVALFMDVKQSLKEEKQKIRRKAFVKAQLWRAEIRRSKDWRSVKKKAKKVKQSQEWQQEKQGQGLPDFENSKNSLENSQRNIKQAEVVGQQPVSKSDKVKAFNQSDEAVEIVANVNVFKQQQEMFSDSNPSSAGNTSRRILNPNQKIATIQKGCHSFSKRSVNANFSSGENEGLEISSSSNSESDMGERIQFFECSEQVEVRSESGQETQRVDVLRLIPPTLQKTRTPSKKYFNKLLSDCKERDSEADESDLSDSQAQVFRLKVPGGQNQDTLRQSRISIGALNKQSKHVRNSSSSIDVPVPSFIGQVGKTVSQEPPKRVDIPKLRIEEVKQSQRSVTQIVDKDAQSCVSQQFKANKECRDDEDIRSEKRMMVQRSHESRKEFDYGTPRNMNFKKRQTYELPAYDRADKKSKIMNKGKHDASNESIGDDNLLKKISQDDGRVINSARNRQAQVQYEFDQQSERQVFSSRQNSPEQDKGLIEPDFMEKQFQRSQYSRASSRLSMPRFASEEVKSLKGIKRGSLHSMMPNQVSESQSQSMRGYVSAQINGPDDRQGQASKAWRNERKQSFRSEHSKSQKSLLSQAGYEMTSQKKFKRSNLTPRDDRGGHQGLNQSSEQ